MRAVFFTARAYDLSLPVYSGFCVRLHFALRAFEFQTLATRAFAARAKCVRLQWLVPASARLSHLWVGGGHDIVDKLHLIGTEARPQQRFGRGGRLPSMNLAAAGLCVH